MKSSWTTGFSTVKYKKVAGDAAKILNYHEAVV